MSAMSQVRAAGARVATRTPPALVGRCWPWSTRQSSGAQRRLAADSCVDGDRSCGRACSRVGAEHAHLLADRAQSVDRRGDELVVGAAVQVGEEHVVAEPLASRPRLDLRQVDLTIGELAQASHEPPRALSAGAPEDDRRLALLADANERRRLTLALACEPDEARFVVVAVLD